MDEVDIQTDNQRKYWTVMLSVNVMLDEIVDVMAKRFLKNEIKLVIVRLCSVHVECKAVKADLETHIEYRDRPYEEETLRIFANIISAGGAV